MFALVLAATMGMQVPQAPVLSAAERAHSLDVLERRMDHFVGTDRKNEVILALRRERRSLLKLDDQQSFIDGINLILRKASLDRHLSVFLAQPGQAEEPADHGIGKIDRLPANVAMVQISSFSQLASSRAAIDAMMAQVADSLALIIDLRSNGGGGEVSYHRLLGHLLPKGHELASIRWRECAPPPPQHPDACRQVAPRVERRFVDSPDRPLFPDRPVYVLISGKTFSAAEAFAWELKRAGRAVIVGERSGGGGSPSAAMDLESPLSVVMPIGRMDPRFGKGWEGVGVTPDIAVGPSDAVSAATRDLSARAQTDVHPLPALRGRAQAGPVAIETIDLSPRFLDFFDAAGEQTPDQRFATWQARYGFAAVPPGPAGLKIARDLLDGSWSRYPAALPQIRAGMAPIVSAAAPAIVRVAGLLRLQRPMPLRLTGFVGSFEGNAFTMIGKDNVPTIALPIEGKLAELAVIVPHEVTHAVHAAVAGFAPGYERSLARVIVEEGLAMHVSEAVVPGRPEAAYTEHKPGWHAVTAAALPEIMRGLRPLLTSARQEDVFRFTMGTGSTGQEREAYAVGWAVVGDMLRHGDTLASIARIPEDQLPARVATVIDRLLASRR